MKFIHLIIVSFMQEYTDIAQQVVDLLIKGLLYQEIRSALSMAIS